MIGGWISCSDSQKLPLDSEVTRFSPGRQRCEAFDLESVNPMNGGTSEQSERLPNDVSPTPRGPARLISRRSTRCRVFAYACG